MDPTTTFDIATAPKVVSRHWKQGTITWGEIVEWLKTPGDRKESGNYLLGMLRPTTVSHKRSDPPCTALHRRKTAIVNRGVLALDVDSPDPDFADLIDLTFPNAAILHTTYSSAPDALRYRLLVPTDRVMLPDEYMHACSVLVARLGKHQFDPGTVQPERFMYKPAAQQRGWFQSWVLPGEPISVDDLLTDFTVDLSDAPMPKPGKNKRDPFDLEGAVGAFNRAYRDNLDLLIENYELPYEHLGENRYHLVGARSMAGMGEVGIDTGLYFSHHMSDPAGGKTWSAFDVVRLHRFSELDEGKSEQTPINRLPSYDAMLGLAMVDARVTAEMVGLDFSDDMDSIAADVSWRLQLRRSARTGDMIDAIDNWDLVRENDVAFKGLIYNEISLTIETTTDLPWRPLDRGGAAFGGVDRAALCHYLEREYGLRPARGFVDELVDTTAYQRFVNPIRDYLDSLVWDGIPRVETSLPGVKPTAYTRLVARKVLTAAVARIYDPGCKWDHTLVLAGPEGLGKTYWVEQLAQGYSASLSKIGDKDTLLTMQRSWIMVSDEGHSLRKADSDVMKEFLTRTEDVFRLPYDRETRAHKRHCVIWGSTNDEVFLRRQEGNRRFLIVKCENAIDFDRLTPGYIGQLWAEAVHLYERGERLFLTEEESRTAATEREFFIEEDALAGIIEEYLETKVPKDWERMSPEQRRMWLADNALGFATGGRRKIMRTCSAQIWVEALGRRFGEHRRADLLDINAALSRMEGWQARPSRIRVPGYGSQHVYERVITEPDSK